MSKLDAQRAMREAKYERQQAAASTRPAKAAAPVAPPTTKGPSAKPASTTGAGTAPGSATGTCGHKSMNGRACTREAGHSEKSHRYS